MVLHAFPEEGERQLHHRDTETQREKKRRRGRWEEGPEREKGGEDGAERAWVAGLDWMAWVPLAGVPGEISG
jgi:hypothetical protein